ncbi:hypothetical protein SEA_RIZWANA_28 [Arthrobacter phage Rizwana]|nr:hypothetical protein SEA_RIZWANA_28 [Arthrobacter phage Rizwana]
MKDFIKSADEVEETVETVTFNHWGTDVTFRKPQEGHDLLMLSLGGREMDAKAAAQFVHMFLNLADEGLPEDEDDEPGFNTRRHFEILMEEGKFGLSMEGGIFDIWHGLVEHFGGKDSKKPSASRASRSRTGASSTGTSRRRASTSSKSRSTAG